MENERLNVRAAISQAPRQREPVDEWPLASANRKLLGASRLVCPRALLRIKPDETVRNKTAARHC